MTRIQALTIPEFMAQKTISSVPKRDALLLLGFGMAMVSLNLVAHDALESAPQTWWHTFQSLFPDASIPAFISDSGYQHVISRKFDESIWPIFVDIGTPLAEVSAGMGVYRMIRGDVAEGWKLVVRSGLGLFLLYSIEPAVKLIAAIGEGFAGGFHP